MEEKVTKSKALVSSLSINGIKDSEYENVDKLAKTSYN